MTAAEGEVGERGPLEVDEKLDVAEGGSSLLSFLLRFCDGEEV